MIYSKNLQVYRASNMYRGNTTSALDIDNAFIQSDFRRSIPPSKWDSGYMQKDPQTPITSQVYPLKTTSETQQVAYEEDTKSDGCCSSVIQCSQETSFSGLKYIGGSEVTILRRVFWLLIVVGALCGLCFQITLSTQKFIGRETVTTLKYVTEDDLDFPSVTFCNINMFRLEKLVSFYGSWNRTYLYGLRQIRQLFPKAGITYEEYSEEFLDDGFPGGLDLYEFVTTSAHSLESMLILCQFNGQQCGPDNFTKTITNFGVCFTFNSIANEEVLSVSTAGQSRGLSVVLNAEEKNVVAAPRENLGFKVLIHPRDEVANLEDFGLDLQPGTHIPIRLDVTEMTTLGKPYGECGSRTLTYLDGSYTESKCYLECETDYIVSQCGCRNFYMPGNATFCSPVELTRCLYNESRIFAAKKTKFCSCPEACKETLYKPTLSQSSFPSRGVATTFIVRDDHVVPAMAFAEAVRNAGSNQFQILYELVTTWVYGMEYGVPGLNNSNNDTMINVFPNTSYALSQILMDDVYGNMQFEIFQDVADILYYEIVLRADSFAPGSDYYWQEYSRYAEMWLESGVYKEKLARALNDTGEYVPYLGNQTFDELIDYIYVDFGLEDSYFAAYPVLYALTYDILLAYGEDINLNIDKRLMVTDFMGKNILHAEVYLGNLKVEQIKEQPAYELFQFVCDLGGALGLFFGASLLSFIETIDFWFSRWGSTKKEEEGRHGTSHHSEQMR